MPGGEGMTGAEGMTNHFLNLSFSLFSFFIV
jgi:hypothetical protein